MWVEQTFGEKTASGIRNKQDHYPEFLALYNVFTS